MEIPSFLPPFPKAPKGTKWEYRGPEYKYRGCTFCYWYEGLTEWIQAIHTVANGTPGYHYIVLVHDVEEKQ